MKEYYEENRIAYQHIPPHNPNCEKVFREGGPVIISPRNGSEYLINRKDPEPIQLRCRVSNDVGKLYWYINNKFSNPARRGASNFLSRMKGR